MAAIGRVQLTRLPEFAKKRVRLAKRYCELLESVQSVGVIYTNYDTCVPHIFPILVDPGIQIEQLRTDLLKRSIETGVHYTPNHRLSFFADRRASKLRVTENIKGRLMSLPLHPDLTLSQIGFIVSNLSDCIRKQNDGIS
jgi:dTDP-4-amino-4,6-dideoxygalactose transaminase